LYREDENLGDNEDQPFETEAQAPNEADVETDAHDKLLLTEPLLKKDGFLVRAQKYEGSMTLKAIW